jgi:hypothetical protein
MESRVEFQPIGVESSMTPDILQAAIEEPTDLKPACAPIQTSDASKRCAA